MKKTANGPKKAIDQKTPGRMDLSLICPAGGSFCDLTAIKFIREMAKCSKPEAETAFQMALQNGAIVLVGGVGLMGTVMAYRAA